MSWKNWPKKLPLRDWQIRFSVNLFPNMLIFSQRIFFLLLQPKPLVHLIALFHFIFKNCCRKYSVYIIGDKHNSSFCVDHFDGFLNVDDDKISTQLSKLQTLMPQVWSTTSLLYSVKISKKQYTSRTFATAHRVVPKPFWWTFRRSDVKIKIKLPTNIIFKTETWSLMRRQEVVRIRSLNSNVKMIFEERSDAIEIDVSRIHEDDVDIHSKL
jgi:hypothetical protein